MTSVFAPLTRKVDWFDYYASGTFYAELVTAAIAIGNNTVADLTLATGGNYARKTGVTLSVSSSSPDALVTVSSGALTWTGLYTDGTAITGLVIVKQLGGAPASSDEIAVYCPRVTDSTISATTTNGSVQITSSALFGSINEYDLVSGTGIAAGSYVREKVDSSTIILNREATTSATNNLTFSADTSYTPANNSGSASDFTFNFPSAVLRI